jgi:hypothetical protein
LNLPMASPWRLRSWVQRFRRPRPVLTAHVSFDETGRGATFSLYRESDRWAWDWIADKGMTPPDPYWVATMETKSRYAIAAMEDRLDLPRTFPLFANIPDALRALGPRGRGATRAVARRLSRTLPFLYAGGPHTGTLGRRRLLHSDR